MPNLYPNLYFRQTTPFNKTLLLGKAYQEENNRAGDNDDVEGESALARAEGDCQQAGYPDKKDGEEDGNVFHRLSRKVLFCDYTMKGECFLAVNLSFGCRYPPCQPTA